MVLGKWVETTRTDFEDVEGFFKKLAYELGATPEEIQQAEDVSELLDLVISCLNHFPAFIVLDDIDSLEPQQQSNLFSAVQLLSGRAFNTGSRFLITSRLELGAGSEQRIMIEGFNLQEFSEYAKMVSEQRSITLNETTIHRLHKVSLGSPVFCSSIIRLVALGADINQAITQWKDKEGEAVREFAFKRELEQLTDSQARTLFALVILGETTQLELKQILNLADSTIIDDLAKLREYHLFASKGEPSTGTKLEAPSTIVLMKDILRKRILDPSRIEKDCLTARKDAPKAQDKIAMEIGAITALWREKEFDSALIAAQNACKKYPKSGDLFCFLGKCYLQAPISKPKEADKAFSQAYDKKCNRPDLIETWLKAKSLSEDWNGIVDLEKIIMPNNIKGMSAYYILNARYELALQLEKRNDNNKAVEAFKETMLAASKTIAQSRATSALNEIRVVCKTSAEKYVRISILVNKRPGDQLNVFNAAFDAFNCRVTNTWIIDSGIQSILIWAKDVDSRPKIDIAALDILTARLKDISVIKQFLQNEVRTRDNLLDKIENAETFISKYLNSKEAA